MTHDDRFDEQPLPLTPQLTYEESRPLSTSVKVVTAARSHRGRLAVNEDQYLVVRLSRHQETLASSLPPGDMAARFEESAYAMVVADGMGANGSGAIASRLAISTLAHLAVHFGKWNLRVDPRTAEEITQRAARFFRRVDERLADVGADVPSLSGMSTTLTAALSAGDSLFVAHVGHSRAYLFRNGTLTQLTRDHTLDQQRRDQGCPTPVELAGQDLGHILTDVIGGSAGTPNVRVEQFRLRHDDCVLLCTNGLTDVISDERASGILGQRRGLHEQCQALIDLALARGAMDNVTVVLARYGIPADAERVPSDWARQRLRPGRRGLLSGGTPGP